MLVVDVVDNRTQEQHTIPVEQYEMQRNNFATGLKDAIYVAVNNNYYEVPDDFFENVGKSGKSAPKAVKAVEEEDESDESTDPVYAEWVTLQAKSKEVTYPKLKAEEKARYQELKALFQAE